MKYSLSKDKTKLSQNAPDSQRIFLPKNFGGEHAPEPP